MGVTYRIPSDVLGLAPDEEEDGLPPSRDTDDLEFAAHYLQRQVGLGGTSHADLQTFPIHLSRWPPIILGCALCAYASSAVQTSTHLTNAGNL